MSNNIVGSEKQVSICVSCTSHVLRDQLRNQGSKQNYFLFLGEYFWLQLRPDFSHQQYE